LFCQGCLLFTGASGTELLNIYALIEFTRNSSILQVIIAVVIIVIALHNIAFQKVSVPGSSFELTLQNTK
jgi:hypothetical protein